jgi:hypothetical protein
MAKPCVSSCPRYPWRRALSDDRAKSFLEARLVDEVTTYLPVRKAGEGDPHLALDLLPGGFPVAAVGKLGEYVKLLERP